jgi:hypothetical protein
MLGFTSIHPEFYPHTPWYDPLSAPGIPSLCIDTNLPLLQKKRTSGSSADTILGGEYPSVSSNCAGKGSTKARRSYIAAGLACMLVQPWALENAAPALGVSRGRLGSCAPGIKHIEQSNMASSILNLYPSVSVSSLRTLLSNSNYLASDVAYRQSDRGNRTRNVCKLGFSQTSQGTGMNAILIRVFWLIGKSHKNSGCQLISKPTKSSNY